VLRQGCSRAELRQFGSGVNGTKGDVVLPSATSFNLKGGALGEKISDHLRSFNVPVSFELMPCYLKVFIA
jgi:hypothetical protein